MGRLSDSYALPYHKTVPISERELAVRTKKANDQDRLVLRHFQQSPNERFSPSQVWTTAFNPQVTPLTSIRRAVTNLTAAGHLEKLEETVQGLYGSREGLWRLRRPM